MYSVYQHWDPLKVCLVGKSYGPEFYNFIQNSRVRAVMERIATETEEDYQKLIKLLESFGVTVFRPDVYNDSSLYVANNSIVPPPMNPRDSTSMIGDTLYFSTPHSADIWNSIKGTLWPSAPANSAEFDLLPESIKQEARSFGYSFKPDHFCWDNALAQIPNKKIYRTGINSAGMTRVGKDLYFGTDFYATEQQMQASKQEYEKMFPDNRCHVINTGGHSDGTFCPVVPGLIVSLHDIPTYQDTFPNWEVVYLPNQSWDRVSAFLELKEKNQGKWWVPGEELNDEFTEFVEQWLKHWVGYVEETVFDVNMLVIDEKNVVCNNYNKQVFDAFSRYGVTAHVVNFRHRYFWDGGLHCITADIHRPGVMNDYFPERK